MGVIFDRFLPAVFLALGKRVNQRWRNGRKMEREDAFPLWAVVLGVAAGGVVAYLMASPRGKTLVRNLPQMLKDLTQQSERVLGIVRELTTEMEQSLQKVESSLDSVQQALERGEAESSASAPFQPRAA
jgi:hypothetical protein